MRLAATALENLPGYEEQLASLNIDIKEQRKKSNQEGQISRDYQGTLLLQSVTAKIKQKQTFNNNMLYHQEKT
eukprot:4091972-Heterocapsa_arctica.AAC.1